MGTPAIAEGVAFAASGSDVVAFSIETGQEIWRTRVKNGPRPASSNVLVHADRVLLAEVDHVLAMSSQTGDVLWTFTPDAQAELCEITADDSLVFFGTRSHRVYALSLVTGDVRWSVDIGPTWTAGIVRGAALAGDTVYISAEQWTSGVVSRIGHIVALTRASGAELWRYVAPTSLGTNHVGAAVRVAGRYLLAPDAFTGTFFAVDRFTGTEVWRVPVTPTSFGATHAPVERDGVVIGATHGGVYAVDLVTGDLRWKREDRVGFDDVAFCGRVLLAQNQAVHVMDPTSGKALGAFLDTSGVDFPTSDFAVSGDRAFVMGSVAAYGITCDE